MRTFIIFALVAFLAIAFVQARPAEEEETSAPETNEVEDADNQDNEENSNDSDNTNDDNEEDAENDNEEESATTEAVRHKKIFWPRFGGHGPVVIRPHVVALA